MDIMFISFPIILYLYIFYIYYEKINSRYKSNILVNEIYIKENINLLINNLNKIKNNEKFEDIVREYENLFGIEIDLINQKVYKILEIKKIKFKVISFVLVFISLPLLILSGKRLNDKLTNYIKKSSNTIYSKKVNKNKIIINEYFNMFYFNKEGVVHRNNKPAIFNLFNMEKEYVNNGKTISKKEFKKVLLQDKIQNF